MRGAKGDPLMKKIFGAFLLIFLLLLSACASPEEPAPEEPQLARLPVTDGINWNALASGGGTAVRPAGFETPISYTTVYFPTENKEINYSDGPLYVTISLPDLDFLTNKQAADKITSLLRTDGGIFLEKAKSFELPYKEGYVTSANGYCYFYFEIVGQYISVTADASFNANTSKENPDGSWEWGEDFVSEYYNEFYCFDAKTGERLTVADVFFTDCDYAALLNPMIASYLYNESWEDPIRPFRGLPEGYKSFAVYSGGLVISLPADSPYTQYSFNVDIPFWSIRQGFDLKPTDKADFKEKYFIKTDENEYPAEINARVMENSDYSFMTLHDDDPNSPSGIVLSCRSADPPASLDKINAEIAKLFKEIKDSDVYKNADKDLYLYVDTVSSVYSNVFSFTISFNYAVNKGNDDYEYFGVERRGSFDLLTGEEIFLSDAVLSEEACIEYLKQNEWNPPDFPSGFSKELPVCVYADGLSFVYEEEYFYVNASVLRPDLWRNIK